MVNFYHRFIPHCAQVLQPLHTLLTNSHANSELEWTEECISAFNSAKNNLAQATLVFYPTPDGTTSYHPQANGLVERFHRQLKAALKTHANATWTESLPLVLLGIRTALKGDLQCTAAELVYGMSLRLPGEFFSPSFSPATPDATYISRLKLSMRNLRATPPRAPNTRNTFCEPITPFCLICLY